MTCHFLYLQLSKLVFCCCCEHDRHTFLVVEEIPSHSLGFFIKKIYFLYDVFILLYWCAWGGGGKENNSTIYKQCLTKISLIEPNVLLSDSMFKSNIKLGQYKIKWFEAIQFLAETPALFRTKVELSEPWALRWYIYVLKGQASQARPSPALIPPRGHQ
jgi:hypothetical protein